MNLEHKEIIVSTIILKVSSSTSPMILELPFNFFPVGIGKFTNEASIICSLVYAYPFLALVIDKYHPLFIPINCIS